MATLNFEIRFDALMAQVKRHAAEWSDEKCRRMLNEWNEAQDLGLDFVDVVEQNGRLIAVPSEEAIRFWEDRGVVLC